MLVTLGAAVPVSAKSFYLRARKYSSRGLTARNFALLSTPKHSASRAGGKKTLGFYGTTGTPMMLGPCASVDNPVFVSCRCGLSHKSKLSYEKFLSAFEDNRHAGYGRVTLDTPGKVVTPVVFERHDSLTPEAAINRLRNKISENPETIQRVSVLMSRLASCFYHISKGNLATNI